MKTNLLFAFASILIMNSSVLAEEVPSVEQVGRYYAYMSGDNSLLVDSNEKSKGNPEYETDLEMMKALRDAEPDLPSSEYTRRFFELRLEALTSN